jgi:DNA-binding NtrC family response regulator
VVVLDLKMPELDGVTGLQQARILSPGQPVIILTAAATPETEQRVHALDVYEFVEKAFSSHRLGDALKRLLKAPTPATVTPTVDWAATPRQESPYCFRTHSDPVADRRHSEVLSSEFENLGTVSRIRFLDHPSSPA